MAGKDQAPATKKDLADLEKRLMDNLREFITTDFREQYISDTKFLNEQLTYDFQGIFKDRTEQHTDRLRQLEQDVQMLKVALGMMAE